MDNLQVHALKFYTKMLISKPPDVHTNGLLIILQKTSIENQAVENIALKNSPEKVDFRLIFNISGVLRLQCGLRACHIKREHSNKVFRCIATKGKSTLGWFFGLKLHLVINDKGEILDFMFTQGHVDDREPLKNKSFHDKIFGKLFGDKGYISQSLFEQLFIDGIHLITRLRKNMKNYLMHNQDRILLKKRGDN